MSKKSPELPVPRDAAEADDAIRAIGEAQRAIERINLELQHDTAILKATAENQAAPHHDVVKQRLAGLEIYAAQHRRELTHDDRVKTVKVAAGVFGWRARPPSVRLSGKLEVIIASIRGMKLGRFLREKVELDKDAMLADAAVAVTIPGVKIASAGEVFFCEPASLGLTPATAG